MQRGSGEMERAAPSRTRWASEKRPADWRGRAPQALPTKSSKDRCQSTRAPKAKRGAAGNEPQEDLGEGGLRDRRRGRGVGGRAAAQSGRRLAQCLQRRSIPGQPVPPRPAPPSSSCPVLSEEPRQLRARPLPRRFLPARRAAPGTRGFGFQAAEPRFAPPAGSTRPPGPEQGRGTLRRSRSASRCPPALVAAPAGAPRPEPGVPRPAPLSSLTPLPPPPPRPATFSPHFFPRPASEQPRPAALCLALALSVLPLFSLETSCGFYSGLLSPGSSLWGHPFPFLSPSLQYFRILLLPSQVGLWHPFTHSPFLHPTSH